MLENYRKPDSPENMENLGKFQGPNRPSKEAIPADRVDSLTPAEIAMKRDEARILYKQGKLDNEAITEAREMGWLDESDLDIAA